MGMYSSYSHCEVEIVDEEGLTEYLKAIKDNKIYPDNENIKFYAEKLHITDKKLEFHKWDEWKIISYWYADMVTFLRDLAVYVEGSVHWTFETEDEAGYIEFAEGELTIHCGDMKWAEYTPEAMVGKELEAMPDLVTKRLMIKKL